MVGAVLVGVGEEGLAGAPELDLPGQGFAYVVCVVLDEGMG